MGTGAVASAQVPAFAVAGRWVRRWIGLLSVVGILSLATWLRTREVSTISLRFDETCSWRISRFPMTEMLDAVSRDAHPPGYYMTLKMWTLVCGDSPAALRGLSILAGVGTAAAAIWLGRLAAGSVVGGSNVAGDRQRRVSGAGMLAGLLVAVSALQVEMSLEARPYTLGTLLTLVSAGLLLRALEHPASYARWIVYAAAAFAASWLHYFAALTVAAQVLFAGGVFVAQAIRTGWSERTRPLGLGLLLTFWLLQIPWAWWQPSFEFQRARSTAQLWMDPLTAENFSEACRRALVTGQFAEADSSWSMPAAAVWLLLSIVLLLHRSLALRLLGFTAVFPLVFVIGYALGVRNILGVRYLIFAQVCLPAGVAAAVACLETRVVRGVLAVGMIAGVGYWSWKSLDERALTAAYPGLQSAVGVINARRQAGDAVIVGSPFLVSMVLAYLRPREDLYLSYRGDHTSNILSGPCLRRADYAGVDQLLERAERRVWFVDGIGLFGQYRTMAVPRGYRVQAEERFAERYGQRHDLWVRELVPLAQVAGARSR